MTRAKNLTLLEFLANGLYFAQCQKDGRVACMWLVLDDTIREKYLIEAKQIMQYWRWAEQEGEQQRAAGNARAFFVPSDEEEVP